MTCIVGLAYEGKVYIGADSAAINIGDYSIETRRDPKVFVKGTGEDAMIFGFSGSFRKGQILNYVFELPKRNADDTDDMTYIVRTFMSAVHECFESNGYGTYGSVEEECDVGGSFIFGYRGNIYRTYDDFHVGFTDLPYIGDGAGGDYAMATMALTEGQDPETRIKTALKTAEKFNASVRGPYVILSI